MYLYHYNISIYQKYLFLKPSVIVILLLSQLKALYKYYIFSCSFFLNIQDIEFFLMVKCNLRTKQKFKLLIMILHRTLTVLNTEDFNKRFVIIQCKS